MTAKEKAKELVDKYLSTTYTPCENEIFCKQKQCKYDNRVVCFVNIKVAKQCALIAVEEIIKQLHKVDTGYNMIKHIEYQNEVKQEIEKL